MSNSGEEKIYFTSDEHLNIVYTFLMPCQTGKFFNATQIELAHEF